MRVHSKEQKYQAILDRATALHAKGKTETFSEVAKFLNKNGFRTKAGNPYAPNPRGIARVVSEAYHFVEGRFGEKKALPIANSFTCSSGDYAWTE